LKTQAEGSACGQLGNATLLGTRLPLLERKEAAMDNVIGFAEITSAIIAAMGLGMCLEWLALSGLMRLMPSRREQGAGGTQSAMVDDATKSGNFKGKSTSKTSTVLTLFPHGI
jgi:hypothetical protein